MFPRDLLALLFPPRVIAGLAILAIVLGLPLVELVASVLP